MIAEVIRMVYGLGLQQGRETVRLEGEQAMLKFHSSIVIAEEAFADLYKAHREEGDTDDWDQLARLLSELRLAAAQINGRR